VGGTIVVSRAHPAVENPSPLAGKSPPPPHEIPPHLRRGGISAATPTNLTLSGDIKTHQPTAVAELLAFLTPSCIASDFLVH